MNKKIYLIIFTLGLCMANFTYSDTSVPNNSSYIRIESLSGVEAEVIKIAVDQFRSEKLNITARGYEITLYLKDDDYLVIFERAKYAVLGTIDPAYEVVVSSKTFKVLHSQFLR